MLDLFSISLPRGSEILSLQVQRGIPNIWVLLDNGMESEKRTFCLYGTGHPVNHIDGKYIGTFQVEYGALMFHLFEVQI
jgi:hypothetical protein